MRTKIKFELLLCAMLCHFPVLGFAAQQTNSGNAASLNETLNFIETKFDGCGNQHYEAPYSDNPNGQVPIFL